jgi:hypothetical protein
MAGEALGADHREQWLRCGPQVCSSLGIVDGGKRSLLWKLAYTMSFAGGGPSAAADLDDGICKSADQLTQPFVA